MLVDTYNAILGGIDLWLREQGYTSVLNLSYRRGSPSYAGVPNVTLPDHRVFLRINGEWLQVGVLKPNGSFSEFDETMLELSDPEMFYHLVVILEGTRGQNTS